MTFSKFLAKYDDACAIQTACRSIDSIAEMLDAWERDDFPHFTKFKKHVIDRYTNAECIWTIQRTQPKNSYPEIHIVIEKRKGGE